MMREFWHEIKDIMEATTTCLAIVFVVVAFPIWLIPYLLCRMIREK